MRRLAYFVAAAVVVAVVGVGGRGDAETSSRVLWVGQSSGVHDLSSGGDVGSFPRGYSSIAANPVDGRIALGYVDDPVRSTPGFLIAGANGECPAVAAGVRANSNMALSWAPDGVRLAVDGIEIVDTGTPGSPHHRVPGTDGGTTPAWYPSANADRIAFTQFVAGLPAFNSDIMLVDVGTGAVSTLIGGPALESDPAWSRDGRLAFVRVADGNSPTTLWTASADGSNQKQLSSAFPSIHSIAWSADGSSLIVSNGTTSRTTPDDGLYRVDVATGTAQRLTTSYAEAAIDAPIPAQRLGYAVIAADGSSYGFGASCSAGPADIGPVVGAAPDPVAPGQWQTDTAGRVRALGNARFLGDLNGTSLNQPIVGIAATPSGSGYWLIARDGGIFSFGDAVFYGSTGAMHLNQPIVGGAASASGHGYWLVAADGGIFSFGDAVFYGSTGALRLNQPIVGMRQTATGNGYWLVASDGGIFSFGDATFYGSTGAIHLNQPIVGMNTTPTGAGYWLVAADGGVFTFGDGRYLGSTGGIHIAGPAAGLVVETFH